MIINKDLSISLPILQEETLFFYLMFRGWVTTLKFRQTTYRINIEYSNIHNSLAQRPQPSQHKHGICHTTSILESLSSSHHNTRIIIVFIHYTLELYNKAFASIPPIIHAICHISTRQNHMINHHIIHRTCTTSCLHNYKTTMFIY